LGVSVSESNDRSNTSESSIPFYRVVRIFEIFGEIKPLIYF